MIDTSRLFEIRGYEERYILYHETATKEQWLLDLKEAAGDFRAEFDPLICEDSMQWPDPYNVSDYLVKNKGYVEVYGKNRCFAPDDLRYPLK